MSDLLQLIAKKDYIGFKKEFKNVFEQKFENIASEIERNANDELSLYPTTEAKYTVDDMNITYKENQLRGMKVLEIELDEMDENSKEVVDFLKKYLSNNDVYSAQDVIADYIKGLKNKDVDEVYIAFESKKSFNESKKMKKVKEQDEEEFKLVSIEAPEDEKSIIIKYELDGDEAEKVLDEEDDIEFYTDIVKKTDDLSDEEMDRIKSDCLEAKKAKKK